MGHERAGGEPERATPSQQAREAPVAQLSGPGPVAARLLRWQRTAGNALVAGRVAALREAPSDSVTTSRPLARAATVASTPLPPQHEDRPAQYLRDVIDRGAIKPPFNQGRCPYGRAADGEIVIGEPRAMGTGRLLPPDGQASVAVEGAVDIESGRIRSIYHTREPERRESVRAAVSGFARVNQPAVFHPGLEVSTVHDTGGRLYTKRVLMAELLTLKGWSTFKERLQQFRPVLSENIRSTIRAGIKGAGRALAGTLLDLGLGYIAAWLWEEGQRRIIDNEVNQLTPVIDDKLAERQSELDDLLAQDPHAKFHVNARFRLYRRYSMGDENPDQAIWHIELDPDPKKPDSKKPDPVCYSRRSLEHEPIEKKENNCDVVTESKIVTASWEIDPEELFSRPRRPVDDPLHAGRVTFYATGDEFRRGFRAALDEFKHGGSNLNPAWLQLMEHASRHPEIKEQNAELWKLLERVHMGRRNADILVGAAGDLWDDAAARGITVREALERRLGDLQVIPKGEQLTSEILRRDEAFLDLSLAHTPHGGYTHMFDELVFEYVLGSREAARRFRKLIGQATGPDTPPIYAGAFRTMPLWQLIWEALVDEFEESQINNPAVLGRILHAHLGLPRWNL